MSDRRTIKTEQIIIEVFLKLLSQKKLSQISVAEITRNANINRGTFYLHYKDVFDLYDQVVKMVLNDLESAFDETYLEGSSTNFRDLTKHIINYVDQKEDVFSVLLNSDRGPSFIEKVRQLFVEKILIKENIDKTDSSDVIDVIYNVNGIVGVLMAWQLGTYGLSEDCMIQQLTDILSKFD
ncbi:TetR/AcrR family transcriptional regulator [Companilactobacillus sp. HBUAS56257]|uniref:TetR/AcrR family transcriptional regulator n=1 Tax=Companilactobacillus sp. HBUAS56257 TaxID=3109360 RepID=UPI002FF18CE2